MYTEQETYKGYTIEYANDPYSDSPAEWGNYTISMKPSLRLVGADNWSRYVDDNDRLTIGARAMLKSGRLWPIRYSEHGNCRYDLAYDADSADGFMEFTEEYAGNAVGLDNLRNMAEQDLETYTAWANGDVWGFTITDRYGKEWDDNTSWGYYGMDDARQAAHDGVESHLKWDRPQYHAVSARELHR